jgi:hypothetical protein
MVPTLQKTNGGYPHLLRLYFRRKGAPARGCSFTGNKDYLDLSLGQFGVTGDHYFL